MQKHAYFVRHKNGWGTGFGPRPTHCHQCGATLPEPANGIGTGYGCGKSEPVEFHADAPTLKPGESLERSPAICHACCHANDVEQLRDRSRPFGAYVSSDGKSISNWPGGKLGEVVTGVPCALQRFSYTHGRTIHAYRVRDVHGNLWHGRGNPGLFITLRPMKG